MNEREYLRLKKQIEDDYRRKLEALEVVWAFASTTSDATAKTKVRDDDGRPSSGDRRGILSLVESVMAGLPEIFTTKDVEGQFARDNVPERSTISHALKRMTKAGQLEIAEAGRGQRAAKYRRIAVASNGDKHGTHLEMATEADRQEILCLAKVIGIPQGEFREQFLDPLGVTRILEMTKEQADSVKKSLDEMIPVAEGST